MKEKRDYEGFFTRPLSWDGVVKKFNALYPSSLDNRLRARIVDAVAHIDEIKVADLTRLLGFEG
jgi:2-methylcitrate dehydratase